jgi:hypothetical protein
MATRRIPPFWGVWATLKVEMVMHKSAAETIAISFLESIFHLLNGVDKKIVLPNTLKYIGNNCVSRKCWGR